MSLHRTEANSARNSKCSSHRVLSRKCALASRRTEQHTFNGLR